MPQFVRVIARERSFITTIAHSTRLCIEICTKSVVQLLGPCLQAATWGRKWWSPSICSSAWLPLTLSCARLQSNTSNRWGGPPFYTRYHRVDSCFLLIPPAVFGGPRAAERANAVLMEENSQLRERLEQLQDLIAPGSGDPFYHHFWRFALDFYSPSLLLETDAGFRVVTASCYNLCRREDSDPVLPSTHCHGGRETAARRYYADTSHRHRYGATHARILLHTAIWILSTM